MKDSEIIRKAVAILETHEWIRVTSAARRDSNNFLPTHVHDPEATCLCGIGAIRRACGPISTNTASIPQRIRIESELCRTLAIKEFLYDMFEDFNDYIAKSKADV